MICLTKFTNEIILEKSFRACAILLITIIIVIIILSRVDSKNVSDFMPIFYFRRQDIWLAAIILFTWLRLTSASGLVSIEFKSLYTSLGCRYCHFFIAAGLFITCYAGHYFLLRGYDVSRDEQMAVFDAIVFADGRLIWPIGSNWRGMASSLNQLFILPIGSNEAWVSAYLPVNSAIRAMFSYVGDQSLASPFFVSIGAIALWKIARIIWPKRRDIGWFCLILYAGSGQILVNGMTAYAMSGHLGFNLVWLWMFLLNRRSADFAALFIGFLVTGMHQPLFHPMFAAPILTILVIQRAWPRAALYIVGYAMICAFWLYWPVAISGLATRSATNAAAGVDYLTRLTDAISGIGLGGIMLMFTNIFRFATWQHLLLIPLTAAGAYSVWKAKNRFAMSLAISLFLPIPVMLILLPYQGHGWGYRYLHPVLGNAIILAGYGWLTLETRDLRRKLLLTASVISFGLLLPLQFYFAYAFYAPWSEADRMITASNADFAVVDTGSAPFAGDLVLNRPDISNRPVRLNAALLTEKNYSQLCFNHGKILIVGSRLLAPISVYFGGVRTGEANLTPQIFAMAKRAGCDVN